jgi:hypothetical protein
MRHWLAVLALWVALSIDFPAIAQVRVDEIAARAVAADLPPAVEYWQGCSSRSTIMTPLRLCPPPEGKVDSQTASYMSGRLKAGLNDFDHFCEIEAAIVRSQHDCLPMEQAGPSTTVAYLMHLLARNWLERNETIRAERWLERAFARAQKNSSHEKLHILRTWALAKVKQDEPQRARELAKQQTAIARQDYDVGGFAGTLIDALKFEADILRQSGFEMESLAAILEVRRIEKLPDPCDGQTLCWGPVSRPPRN